MPLHSEDGTLVLLVEVVEVVLDVVVAPALRGLRAAVVPIAGGGGEVVVALLASAETAVTADVDASEDRADPSVRCCCSRCNLVVTPLRQTVSEQILK